MRILNQRNDYYDHYKRFSQKGWSISEFFKELVSDHPTYLAICKWIKDELELYDYSDFYSGLQIEMEIDEGWLSNSNSRIVSVKETRCSKFYLTSSK